MSNPILSELKESVLHITLNNPERLNPFTLESSRALREVLADLATGQPVGVRAVLLQARGKYFSAGGDIKFFQELTTLPATEREAALGELIDHVHAIVDILLRLPVPVVAAVQGGAAGFGLSLLAACDWVVAAQDSSFSTAYMGLGATPDGGTTWLLPRLMGLRAARQLILQSERCSGEDALRLGLVDRLAAADELAAVAQAQASRLAEGPTLAYGKLKTLLADSYQSTLPEQLAAEKVSFLACSSSADFSEGLHAFEQRRKACFRGH